VKPNALDRFSRAARKLGQRTAELHLALGGDEAKKDPAFAPEPVAREDLAALERRMRASLDRVCAKLGGQGDLLARRAELEAKIERVSELPPGAFEKTRCHGDYHLGQVLVDSTGSDFLIIDFEGEPAAPLDERRAKAPPQKDVAGMIRSFDYAAHAAARELGRGETEAAHWSNECAGAFLEGYRAAFPGADDAHFNTLLEAYVLDKTLYELTYELDNRPTWLDIPLRALIS
jgi:maltose alpha-D-glucosyltransferase / alpha-amylase